MLHSDTGTLGLGTFVVLHTAVPGGYHGGSASGRGAEDEELEDGTEPGRVVGGGDLAKLRPRTRDESKIHQG